MSREVLNVDLHLNNVRLAVHPQSPYESLMSYVIWAPLCLIDNILIHSGIACSQAFLRIKWSAEHTLSAAATNVGCNVFLASTTFILILLMPWFGTNTSNCTLFIPIVTTSWHYDMQTELVYRLDTISANKPNQGHFWYYELELRLG